MVTKKESDFLSAEVTNHPPTPTSAARSNVFYRNRTVQQIRTEGITILNSYRPIAQFVTGSSNQVSK